MAIVNGTSGNDVIEGDIAGVRSSDTLNGYAGDDYLYGLSENDTLYGGDGNDNLYGGSDVDQRWGGAGDDYFWVEFLTGLSYDNYFGGSGYDTIIVDRSAVDIYIGQLSSIEEIYSPLAGGVTTGRIIGS